MRINESEKQHQQVEMDGVINGWTSI